MSTRKQTQSGASGMYFLTFLAFLLALAYGLAVHPAHTQIPLTGTVRPLANNGPVFRYQIAAASETAEVTPSLIVDAYAYATIQVLGSGGTGTGPIAGGGSITVKGSAIPDSDYLSPLPATIGSATTTATITHYGIYTYELFGVNSLYAAIASNAATQELIISLSKNRQ